MLSSRAFCCLLQRSAVHFPFVVPPRSSTTLIRIPPPLTHMSQRNTHSHSQGVSAASGPPSSSLFLANLPWGASEQQLKQWLIRQVVKVGGRIGNVNIQKRPDGSSRGFAFVQAQDIDTAKHLFDLLHSSSPPLFQTRQLLVEYSSKRKSGGKDSKKDGSGDKKQKHDSQLKQNAVVPPLENSAPNPRKRVLVSDDDDDSPAPSNKKQLVEHKMDEGEGEGEKKQEQKDGDDSAATAAAIPPLSTLIQSFKQTSQYHSALQTTLTRLRASTTTSTKVTPHQRLLADVAVWQDHAVVKKLRQITTKPKMEWRHVIDTFHRDHSSATVEQDAHPQYKDIADSVNITLPTMYQYLFVTLYHVLSLLKKWTELGKPSSPTAQWSKSDEQALFDYIVGKSHIYKAVKHAVENVEGIRQEIRPILGEEIASKIDNLARQYHSAKMAAEHCWQSIQRGDPLPSDSTWIPTLEEYTIDRATPAFTKDNKTPLVNDLALLTSHHVSLTKEHWATVHEVCIGNRWGNIEQYLPNLPVPIQTRLLVLNKLQGITKKTFPNSSFHVAGSFISGTARLSSDVDVVLSIPSPPPIPNEFAKVKLRTLQRQLQALKNELRVDASKLHARFPVLTVTSKGKEEICVDIAVVHGDEYRAQGWYTACEQYVKKNKLNLTTPVFNTLKSLHLFTYLYSSSGDRRALELLSFISWWSKARELNDAASQTLNSFSWSIMAIYALQNTNPPVLPTLPTSPEMLLHTVVDEGKQSKDVSKLFSYKSKNDMSLVEIIYHFFDLYSNFDIHHKLVNILPSATLTPPFPTFTIQDPIELQENPARSLHDGQSSNSRWERIRREMERGKVIIQEYVQKKEKNQSIGGSASSHSDLFNSLCFPLQAPTTSGATSSATMDWRRQVYKVFG